VSRESGCFALLVYFATIVVVALLGLFKLFNSQYAESYNYLVWVLIGISVFFLATGYSRDEKTETEPAPLSECYLLVIVRIVPREEQADDDQPLATDEEDSW
jgi:hypothetical protein